VLGERQPVRQEMGAGQSTRKITVVNDEVSGVIKISDGVVRRLKEEITTGEAATTANPAPESAAAKVEAPPPPPSAQEVPSPPLPPAVAAPPEPSPETLALRAALLEAEQRTAALVAEKEELVAASTAQQLKLLAEKEELSAASAAQQQKLLAEKEELSAASAAQQRQLQQEKEALQEQLDSVPPPPPEIPAPPPPVEEVPLPAPSPTPAPAPAAPQVVVDWQRPIIQYIEEPSLSALKVKAEKELELRTLEEYWKDRLRLQQEQNSVSAGISEVEIAKKMEYVETLFRPAAVNRQLARESGAEVAACYSAHPGAPLLCRDAVLQFTDAVQRSRLDLVKSG